MTPLPRLLPLFPLPDVVLFPKMPLPLHIFEPRYYKMVDDAMKTHKMVGMVLLKPGWEGGYEGRPPIYPMGCAGAIEQCELLEGNRFNILLRGVSRFHILEEHPDEPYRVATADPRPESSADGALLDARRQRLLDVVGRTAAVLVIQPDLPHDVFVNALSQSMDLAPIEKQSLLEEDDIPSRYERLTQILSFRQLEQAHRTTPNIH
jgi:Lon protease-like protein